MIYIYIYIHTYIHTYIYYVIRSRGVTWYMCLYYVYIYTHTHTHIHTYIHTYIHNTLFSNFSSPLPPSHFCFSAGDAGGQVGSAGGARVLRGRLVSVLDRSHVALRGGGGAQLRGARLLIDVVRRANLRVQGFLSKIVP
jgi:hypothetical protein